MLVRFDAALVALMAGLLQGAWGMRPDQITQRDLPLNTSGRGSFSARCSLDPGKRMVLVTVSSDYFAMFENWLGFAEPFLRDTEHLYVMAEDQDVVGLLSAMLEDRAFSYTLASPEIESSFLGGAALIDTHGPYDTKSYGKVVWNRPNHIFNLLKKGCTVLYSDIDTVWAKDPFAEIGKMSGYTVGADAADLFITDDRPKTPGEDLCTCFMYWQPTAASERLLASWASSKEGNTNQLIFNTVLAAARKGPAQLVPKYQVLPVSSFPPGSVAWRHWSAAVYHANWREGMVAKVNFFKFRRMWKPDAAMK